MKKFKFASLVLAPLFAVLAACGGGGGGDKAATPSTPSTATLSSITVTTPDNATTIAIGAPSKTLIATGSYSDGSKKALTAAGGLVWGPVSSNVLQIATNGAVTAKGVGTETVTATVDKVVGSLAITVTASWMNVSTGGYQTVARKADGNLYSWGSNIKGQLGDSSTVDREKDHRFGFSA